MKSPHARALALTAVLAGGLAPRTGRAQEAGLPDVAEPDGAERAAAHGLFLPLTMAPSVRSQRGFAVALGGWDGARRAAVMEATAEITVWGPFALRGGAVYGAADGTLKPTIGGRLQALRQERHGVDGAVGVFYRPEGLTEAEGEIESVVSLGRRLGRWGTFAHLAYGQDPEGRERDGEVRLAALHAARPRLYAGLDGRVRFDLGSDAARLRARREATFDLLAGPSASWAIGSIALVAQAGVAGVRIGELRWGVSALGGVGTAF